MFRAILNHAEKREMIERNPLNKAAFEKLPVPDEFRTVYFEPEEWRQLIAAFDNPEAWRKHVATDRKLGPVLGFPGRTTRRYGGGRREDSEASAAHLGRLAATVPVMRMLLFTGSRLGEITGLQWEHVDKQRGLLSIYQQKTRRVKVVPITAKVGQILAAQPQGIGKAPVFVRPDGSPVVKEDVQRAFRLALKLAGITKAGLVPHSIRHTAGSWLAIAGFSERQQAELLGHAQRSVTSRYAHLAPAHMRPVVEALERIEAEGLKGQSGDVYSDASGG